MGKEKGEEKKSKSETKPTSTKASTASSHSTSDSRTHSSTVSKAPVTLGKPSLVTVTAATATTSLKQPTATTSLKQPTTGGIPTTTRLSSTVDPTQSTSGGSRSLTDDGGFHFRQSVHMVRELFPDWSSEQVFAKATEFIRSSIGTGQAEHINPMDATISAGMPDHTNHIVTGAGMPDNTNYTAYGSGLPGNTTAEAYGSGLPGNTNAEVARTEEITATDYGRIRRKANATATASSYTSGRDGSPVGPSTKNRPLGRTRDDADSFYQTASPSRGARKRMSDDFLDTAPHHSAKRSKKAAVAALLAQMLDSDEEEDVSWERPVSVTASGIAGPQSCRFGSPLHLRSVDDFDEYEEEDAYSTPSRSY